MNTTAIIIVGCLLVACCAFIAVKVMRRKTK